MQISIFNIKGEEVISLVNELTDPGVHSINWDATSVASGIYFVHFTAINNGLALPIHKTQKLMLIK